MLRICSKLLAITLESKYLRTTGTDQYYAHEEVKSGLQDGVCHVVRTLLSLYKVQV